VKARWPLGARLVALSWALVAACAEWRIVLPVLAVCLLAGMPLIAAAGRRKAASRPDPLDAIMSQWEREHPGAGE